MKLTEAQIRHYREHGFAHGNRLLGEADLARLRREMAIEIDRLPPGSRPENMPSLHYHNEVLRDLVLSEPFVDIAAQILGPNVALFTVYAISKRPDDGLPVHAAEHGLIVVAPDTSPRGVGLPGEDDASDFGSGAGFYVDATEEPWAAHYRMYSYVTAELPALVNANFPTDPRRQGIFGHSMGGHGALICALRNPDKYRSLSAFAPVCSATRCPWGEKALSGYLGADRDAWRANDASLLAAQTDWASEILIDQGTADDFLEEQLKPHLLQEACAAAGIPLTMRYQAGYDHSYYFMASFMAEHVAHHAQLLKA